MSIKILSVAGFKIGLQPEHEGIFTVEPESEPFITEGSDKDTDILVKMVTGFPDHLQEETGLLFDARDGQKKFFSIFRHEHSIRILIYDRKNPFYLRQIAIPNKGFDQWTVYSKPGTDSEELYPLRYPLGPLLYYYLTVKYDALMIHASGIFDGTTGRLFTGCSGAGKSTMAALWKKSGSRIINDDRLIIRKEGEVYFMYNTPMQYITTPDRSELHSIFLISHGKENSISNLTGATAVSRIMANCVRHDYDRGYISHHLDFLARLCSKIAVYDLAFKPDQNIVNFIRNEAF